MGKKQQAIDPAEFTARLQQDAHVAAANREEQDILANLLTIESQVGTFDTQRYTWCATINTHQHTQIWRMEENHSKMMFQSGNAIRGKYKLLQLCRVAHTSNKHYALYRI